MRMLRLEQLARAVVAQHVSMLSDTEKALAAHLDELAADRRAHEGTIGCARSNYAEPSDDDIEIDDEPMLSIADDGVWVSAWVWVPTPDEE